MTPIERSPKPVGTVFSLAAGVTAVALVATTPSQIRAILVETLGIALLVLGMAAYRRYRSPLGPTLAIAGLAIVLGAIGLGWLGTRSPSARFELLPGMAGLGFLAAGVGGVRSGWGRGLLMVGTGGLLVGVLTSGVVHGAPAPFLLGATVASVVAWDAGEQAINLGEQVGSRAVTWPAELVHVAGSAVVGAAGVALAIGVYRVGLPSVNLAGLFLLLVGAVTLTAALYN